VCRRRGVATGQFYSWENQARQGALEALHNKQAGRKKNDATAQLEAKALLEELL